MVLTPLYLLPQKSSPESAVQHDHEQPLTTMFWLEKNNLIFGRIILKKSHLLGAVCACVLTLFATTSQAALIERLGGLAYYDDIADLTWLADANAAGTTMNWADANAWAAGLNVGGVIGWRLPTSLNSDGSGPCGPAYDCTGSEMGNLFYNVLGNSAGSLTDTGPFSNVQSGSYWSSTEYAPNTASAWYFNFLNGYQPLNISKDASLYAWAVHDGKVGAVPVPAAVWLFGSGLLGLIGLGRQRRR